MAAIAVTVDDLDATFVGDALGHSGAVRGVTATRIGTGQVALSLRLDIAWADGPAAGRPASVIAKIPAPEAASREAARLHRTYHLEVGFYRDVSSMVSVPHPRALHAEIDPASGDFTLLMEPATGAVGDQLAGCTVAQATAMVDAAVGLHAPTWDRVGELGALDWLPTPDPSTLEVRVAAYRALLPGFVDRFSSRLDGEVIGAARWLGDHLVDVASAYRSPFCLTHGDYRLDNLLFASTASGGSTVTVLDWQTVAFGRGAVDIAYGLGSGLLPDDRRQHEAALVDRYVDGLVDAGVDCVPDDVRRDHRLGTVSGLGMAVIASQLVAPTERGDEMFAVMAERHARQMTDNDVYSLV
jgi:hypothetical protein